MNESVAEAVSKFSLLGTRVKCEWTLWGHVAVIRSNRRADIGYRYATHRHPYGCAWGSRVPCMSSASALCYQQHCTKSPSISLTSHRLPNAIVPQSKNCPFGVKYWDWAAKYVKFIRQYWHLAGYVLTKNCAVIFGCSWYFFLAQSQY